MKISLGVISKVCPVKVNPNKFGPLPIFGNGIMFLKGLWQIVGVSFTHVFNTKVVKNENKNNWAPFVAPEPMSCGRFIVTGFVEAFVEMFICLISILWQAIASLENSKIDPSIEGVSSEVIFVNEFLRYVQDLDVHILRTLHGSF